MTRAGDRKVRKVCRERARADRAATGAESLTNRVVLSFRPFAAERAKRQSQRRTERKLVNFLKRGL
mgnify:FL=1